MLDAIDTKRGEDGIFGGSLKKDHIPAGQAILREIMDEAYGQLCQPSLPFRPFMLPCLLYHTCCWDPPHLVDSHTQQRERHTREHGRCRGTPLQLVVWPVFLVLLSFVRAGISSGGKRQGTEGAQ